MGKFLYACSIFVLLTGCNSEERIKKEIQAALDQCVLAVNTKNIDLYMEGIPDGFEIKDENGETITKEMQREYALMDWSIIDTTLNNKYAIDSLTVYGDSAVVYTSQKWRRLMLRRDGITKDTVLTTQDHKELWMRRNDVWLNYQIEELGGKIYVNGKEYIP